MITFVLVTHESAHHFPMVVDNIRRFTPFDYEIIVVDNGSRRTDYVAGDKIILNDENLHFTVGANQGLAAADQASKYLILINPDIRLHAHTMRDLLNDVSDCNAGVAAPILVYPNLLVQHAGGQDYAEMNDANLLALDRHRHFGAGVPLARLRAQFPRPVRWVTGAMFLITRNTYDLIGPLDTRYSHYKSDLEYCLRAAQRGIEVICSRAVSLHLHKTSSRHYGPIGRWWARALGRWQTAQFERNFGREC